MNYKSINCLSVLTLSLAVGLSACGKGASSTGSAPTAAPSVRHASADTLDTLFETSCDTKGSDGSITPSSITANAAFDLTSCQIGSSQRDLIKQVGALKVQGDCVAQTVTILSSAGDVLGSQNYDKEGNFSVSLNLDQYNEVQGCPVSLQGLATGKVSCDGDNHVSKIDMTTAYTLAQGDDASASSTGAVNGVGSVSAIPGLLAMNDESDHGDRAGDHSDERGGDRDRDHDRDGNQGGKFAGKGGVVIAPMVKGGGQQGKGDAMSAQQGGKVFVGSAGAKGKGGQGGNWGHIPHDRVGACMNFNPCTFNSHASLNCAQPSTVAQPATVQPTATTAPAQPAAVQPTTAQPAAQPATLQPASNDAAQPAAVTAAAPAASAAAVTAQ